MIDFLEHHSTGYSGRTYENAGADCTIAFALDFSTSGEVLTKRCVESQHKLYIPVPVDPTGVPDFRHIAQQLTKHKVRTINIAGNSLYTAARYTAARGRPGITQRNIDQTVYNLLWWVFEHPAFHANIVQIRSGGQSGFDEAGLKAAEALDIPGFCLCPQGWPFITAEGKTIRNEKLFKARFKK